MCPLAAHWGICLKWLSVSLIDRFGMLSMLFYYFLKIRVNSKNIFGFLSNMFNALLFSSEIVIL